MARTPTLLLFAAVELHKQQFGHAPKLMTTDAGFFSAANEAAARELGVKRISMPNRSSKSPQRRLLERKRWFREAQRWRTGCGSACSSAGTGSTAVATKARTA